MAAGFDGFDTLQRRLVPLWSAIRQLSATEQTIVVLPSLSVDPAFLEKVGPRALVYEERFLFLLLLLRQPRATCVFISSMPTRTEVIDYYLSLMPGIIPAHARRRLHLVSMDDMSLTPLARKLLESPEHIERIRSLISDTHRAHLVPFVTTEVEQQVALALDIPVYGADPRFNHFGTKSGGRKLFRAAGVPLPPGAEDLHTLDDLVGAIADLRLQNPAIGAVIAKVNEGVSGHGNAKIDLSALPEPGDPAESATIAERVLSLEPEADDVTAEELLASIATEGGVVEQLIWGDRFTSPSVQLRVTPLGELEVLSTHDQLLGGKGQTYMGCVFPADSSYARQITESAVSVGKQLAAEGVIGRFAIDFIVVQRGDRWDHYAVEINLRKGGTTHPYLTLQFLTAGSYDPVEGVFRTPSGEPRCLVATDYLQVAPGMDLDGLFERAMIHGLHFDNSTQSGVVFHMLGGIEAYGIIGMTAVADTREAARELFDRTSALLSTT